MSKIATLNQLQHDRLVAVLRASDAEEGKELAHTAVEGGIRFLEMTYTIPGATQLIHDLSDYYRDRSVIVGAGTVLDATTARMAIMNGAQFIVSPWFDEETAYLCNTYQIPYIPGCTTVNEMKRALEVGCDVVKLFPGDAFGPETIRSIKAPLPQANIMPSGGVSLDNAEDWLTNGAFAVSTGSSLTKGSREDMINKAEQFKTICQRRPSDH
ncbi:bifunctional 2-keto-4-hydroxyglutarate aldolase/2-keto-3-deoxy-6-phosphogluconate aldolase [Thalassobacillus sp. CUG 92003]|uniref:bifunctional 2-keto-4-hydroxyglutarate aldolase/2-keto-3-deoxy-6-phosphogluconate aldolase n=1 Tax=Thalassobacillus sp. CUG 92003 TaxID=2736641 RepID=UPI0015E6D57C